MDDEDKRVVVFNLLHSRLSGQGMLHNGIVIQLAALRGRLSRILRRSALPKRLWAVKANCRPLFPFNCNMSALQDGLLGFQSVSLRLAHCGYVNKSTLGYNKSHVRARLTHKDRQTSSLLVVPFSHTTTMCSAKGRTTRRMRNKAQGNGVPHQHYIILYVYENIANKNYYNIITT